MTPLLAISETAFITLKIVATIVFVGFWILVFVRLLARGRSAYERTSRLPLESDDPPVQSNEPSDRSVTSSSTHGEDTRV